MSQTRPIAGRGGAAHDERVEAVEAAERAERDLAALRRVRVDIGEIREIGGQRGLAEHREAMARGHVGRARPARGRLRARSGAAASASISTASQGGRRHAVSASAGPRGIGARTGGEIGQAASSATACASSAGSPTASTRPSPSGAQRLAVPVGHPAAGALDHRHQRRPVPQLQRRSRRSRRSGRAPAGRRRSSRRPRRRGAPRRASRSPARLRRRRSISGVVQDSSASPSVGAAAGSRPCRRSGRERRSAGRQRRSSARR